MKTDFLQPDKMGPYASFEVPKKTEKQEKKQKNVLYVEVSGMNECTPVSGTGTRYKFRNEKSGGRGAFCLIKPANMRELH